MGRAPAAILLSLTLVSCQFDRSGLTPPDAGVPPTCGDGVRDPGEACDGDALGGETCQSLGYDSGALACTGTCSLDLSGCVGGPTCGNGVAETPEACDGGDLGGETCETLGYDSGTLACTGTCSLDPSGCVGEPTCGNGVAEEPEACDGNDLDGRTCASERGLADGLLTCTPGCTVDSSACFQCGNGAVEGPEECDGNDLGGQACTDFGFERGALGCTPTCTFTVAACANYPLNWIDQSWVYRKAITVPATQVTADLPRFPLLVTIVDADLQAHALPSGDDLRFTAGDGLTPVPHEIEAWDGTSGALTAWVQVPLLSASAATTVYLYFGNPASGPQANPAGVWDASHQGVWHLSEGGTGNRADSTSHAYHAVPAGYDGDEATPGRIHGADLLDGTNDRLELPSGVTAGLTTFTFCFWIKTTESGSDGTFWHNPTLLGQVTTGFRSGDFAIITSSGAIGLWSGLCPGDDAGILSTVLVNDDQWHYVCAANDNTNIRLYVDDAYVDQTCSGGRAVAGLAYWVGAHSGQSTAERGDYHQGAFDELRVSNVARPVAWMSASYRNQFSPVTFYAVGPLEDVLP